MNQIIEKLRDVLHGIISALVVGLFLVFLALESANAAHIHHEKYYQQIWCEQRGGITEYRLPDGTRVDCLLPEYAIEFDFANKWAESIGQSLYYGLMTERKPGVVLIFEKPKDWRYLPRFNAVADEQNIKLWTTGPEVE